MIEIAYYVPNLPDVWSIDYYQHALAITEVAEKSILLSNQKLPNSLVEKADVVRIIESDSMLARGNKIAKNATQLLDPGGLFVSGTHQYECVIAGFLARQRGLRWIPDVFETPAMPRLGNPWSIHQLTSRASEMMLNSVDFAIHSFHPDTPYQYGKRRGFLTNGSPISQLDPNISSGDMLRVVLVGSNPSFRRGGEYLLRAANNIEEEIDVHICGKESDDMSKLATKLSVEDTVTFHGWVDHSEALNQIALADVGYCVLTPRTDFIYAPPIKVGEYLAGGTIPLVSELPGSRYVADEAGYYVTPSTEGVLKALSELASNSSREREQLKQKARSRGEEIAWENIRKKFADMLVNNS